MNIFAEALLEENAHDEETSAPIICHTASHRDMGLPTNERHNLAFYWPPVICRIIGDQTTSRAVKRRVTPVHTE